MKSLDKFNTRFLFGTIPLIIILIFSGCEKKERNVTGRWTGTHFFSSGFGNVPRGRAELTLEQANGSVTGTMMLTRRLRMGGYSDDTYRISGSIKGNAIALRAEYYTSEYRETAAQRYSWDKSIYTALDLAGTVGQKKIELKQEMALEKGAKLTLKLKVQRNEK